LNPQFIPKPVQAMTDKQRGQAAPDDGALSIVSLGELTHAELLLCSAR